MLLENIIAKNSALKAAKGIAKTTKSEAQAYIDEIKDSGISLDIRSYAVPNDLSKLTLEQFTKIYREKFPNSILFKEEHKVTFQVPNAFNNSNIYFSTNICYVREEFHTCSGKPYRAMRGKINTYYLCPICEPFQQRGCATHIEKREGASIQFEANEPRFYDTLHGRYDHHMNDYHGVYRDGSIIPTPLVGFVDSSRGLALQTICPLAEKNSDSAPCLGMFKLNLSIMKQNPYKGYLRHYSRYHLGASKTVENKECYNKDGKDGKPNIVIPLNSKSFADVLRKLKDVCPEVMIHFERDVEFYHFDDEKYSTGPDSKEYSSLKKSEGQIQRQSDGSCLTSESREEPFESLRKTVTIGAIIGPKCPALNSLAFRSSESSAPADFTPYMDIKDFLSAESPRSSRPRLKPVAKWEPYKNDSKVKLPKPVKQKNARYYSSIRFGVPYRSVQTFHINEQPRYPFKWMALGGWSTKLAPISRNRQVPYENVSSLFMKRRRVFNMGKPYRTIKKQKS